MSKLSDNSRIAILYGPCNSGKSFLLWRLLNWLYMEGYSFHCDPFMYKYGNYDKTMDILLTWSHNIPNSKLENFFWPILIDIIDCSGKLVYKIYYQPGCFSFDTYSSLQHILPQEFYDLMKLKNPKKWILFSELSWCTQDERAKYCVTIQDLKHRYMSTKDDIIILCPKIDREYCNGYINYVSELRVIFHELNHEYSGLIGTFRNVNRITKLYKPYNFFPAVFSSGNFSQIDSCNYVFIRGSDYYPKQFWKLINK